ncbi:uncharacterized protein LTR77_009628 [Saxophila tyrrhenica]|uniref:Uncharacterized protein n=1 Tax=Saxophila tyrrhenica TaxID=1690608 RepID=A0AAV9NZ56_9PEZI|nr:hypothetical protein LTR77_009628 [Saxophila tyrrhenica]
MSSGAAPIDPARFAEALESLPLDSLHAKAAELRNSIAHLKSSNEQMLPFADEGDADCREAMFENLAVIGRMNERIDLLRKEVEGRGMRWAEGEVEDAEKSGTIVNGHVDGEMSGVNGTSGETAAQRAPSGRLTDEELRRRLEAEMGGADEEDGVYL